MAAKPPVPPVIAVLAARLGVSPATAARYARDTRPAILKEAIEALIAAARREAEAAETTSRKES
jgi:hypothetical protein